MATLVDSGGSDGDKGGTVTVTLSSAPTSGNIIVFGAIWADGTSTLSATPNSMTSAGIDKFDSVSMEFFYKIANGTETAAFTATLSTGGVSLSAFAAEYNGPDAFQSITGNSGTSTTPTGASNGDGDTTLNLLCVGLARSSGGTFTSPSSGYSIDVQQAVGGVRIGLLSNLTGASSSTPSCTSASDTWYTQHATFEGPASSGQQILTLRHDGKY